MGDNQERVGRGSPRSGRFPSWAGRGASGALGGVLVLLVALALRAPHLDWDQGTAAHPDERAVAFAAERIALARGKLDPDFFAYGSLPLYLLAGAREAVAAVTGTPVDFGRTLLLGRVLSVLAALLTIAVAVGAGRRLGGTTAGLLAGALLALCPLHLQNSRFATVDVLLTLLASVSVAALARWAEEERRADLIVAAVAAGLALATKVAALLLIVPALAALWSVGRGRGLRRTLVSAGLGLGVALAAFAAAQPMTLIRPARVLRDLAEQSAIVRHAGIVPYTFQYVGSRPFIDPLIDLALWGLGPALALAAALGVGSALRPRGAARRPAAIVWAAWALGFFLCLGGLETQFPRYLLPIYPALLVLAAVPLARWVRSPVRWRRVALGLLLAVAAAQAIAVASIAYRPHPFFAAAAWLRQAVPEGGSVLLPDWDEGLPLDSDGDGSRAVEHETFNFYDRPDNGQKLERLALALGRADYLVFPTRRIYGSVARVPDRLPVTSAFLRLLFLGRAGFVLERTFSSRPSLFGLELPDELGDESLTVYDHPRVLVFRRVAPVSVATLTAGLDDLAPTGGPDRAAMLTAEPGRALVEANRPARRGGLAGFALVVELLSVAGLLVVRRCGATGPVAAAAARALGVFGFGWLAWLAVSLGLARFARADLLGLLAVVAALAFASRTTNRGRARADWSDWLAPSLLFWGAFALMLFVRARDPAVFWGEKPMDFSFLAQLDRTSTLPPLDPWFAGTRLSYSYFGHFLVALVARLAAVPARVAFNLGLALFAGLAATTAYAAGLAVSRRRRMAFGSAAFVLLLGNLSGPWVWMRLHRLDFDYFWASSRVIPDTINEYPLWSFLFADLHAHLMAIPLLLLAIALAASTVRRPRRRWLAWGWLLGALAVTSSWSLPSSVGLALLALIVAARAACRDAALPGLARAGGAWAVALVTSLVLFAPYWASFHPPATRFGVEHGRTATWGELALLFGAPALVLAPALLRAWRRTATGSRARRRLLQLGSLALLVAATALARGAPRGALAALALLAVGASVSRRARPRERTLLLLAGAGLTLLAASENLWIWDRMNTVFKYGYEAGLLFAVVAPSALRPAWDRRTGPRLLGSRPGWRVWQGAVVLVLATAAATSASAAFAQLRRPRVESPRPGLDGWSYLERSSPALLAALDWLDEQVPGSPTLVEAWGPSYGEFARISSLTGIPTPLGWDYHVLQRGHPVSEIDARKREIVALYGGTDLEDARSALSSLGADYVYVGELERRTYGALVEQRMASLGAWLHPVYRNGSEAVYRVRRWALDRVSPDAGATAAAPAPVLAPPSFELREPRGLALVGDDVWVADFGNDRLVRLDRELVPRAVWGSSGSHLGELRQPCAVAAATSGMLVADTWNHRALRIDGRGEVVTVYQADLFGPRGVAEDPASGDVLVSDTGNHRIVRFSTAGKLLGVIGGPGQGPGQLDDPAGIVVGPGGWIAVANNGDGRLEIFDPHGRPLRSIPVPGWRREVYSEPQLAVSRDGRIWAAVPLAHEIDVFAADGRSFGRILAGADGAPDFGAPMGLAAAPDGTSLIVSSLDGRVLSVPTTSLASRPADAGGTP